MARCPASQMTTPEIKAFQIKMDLYRLIAIACPFKRSLVALLFLTALAVGALIGPATASAAPLDELSLERWADLREAERYQLNIAEKY